MATIECILKIGPKRELMATNTREIEKLSKLKVGQEVRVKILTEPRSLSSNALSHQWYKDAALQTSDTPQEVRTYCKLTIGVPIMLAESEKFAEKYNHSIRRTLTYEQKLSVMDLLDVAFTARVVGMWATDWHFEDNDRLDFSKFNDSDYKVFIYDSYKNHFDQSEPHKLSDGSVQLANPAVELS